MKDRNITGFPFKTRIFGGFKKTDVTEYIERLADQIEKERAAMDQERLQLYELLRKNQMLCDNYAWEAQKNAEALIEQAHQEADEMVTEAESRVQLLRDEHQLLFKRSQSDVRKMTDAVIRQQQETARTYEQLLLPLQKLLDSLGGEQDAS